ncbi:MAG TPA: hypothetical protein VLK65_26420 [Vicinamibacteria bacterium]|nr:hypothetical protein [Vicinamibacteria bacterium]
MYRTIRADEILKTAENLRNRIQARFPECGLRRVSDELLDVARETQKRCERIKRPNIPLRVSVVLLLAFGLSGIVGLVVTNVRMTDDFWNLSTFAEAADALLGDIVFLGAGIAFLVTLETRVKRTRALAAINELRAIAHIVDMHQLTKDPEMVLTQHPKTDVSPDRNMTPFELNRYLDYCSEMLALISKVGALYVQSFPDSQALAAVDEIENLTTALSRKIWQKIMILDRYTPRRRSSRKR